LPAIWAWLETVASAAPESAEQHIDFLHDAMKRLAPSVREVAAAHLSGDRYEVSAYEAQEGHVETLYSTRVLPVEDRERNPLDPRTVLLGAWLYALAEAGGEPEHLPDVLSNTELERFVGKALEMGAVLRTWKTL
jgi:hypothetical protein